MKTLGIVGAGDLGQQIAHYAISDHHYRVAVFYDDFTEKKVVNGIQVVGKVSDIENGFKSGAFDELIIAIGYKHLSYKSELFDKFSDNIPFGKIIHSSAWIDVTAVVMPGTVIYPCCSVDAHSVIESNCILNIGSTVCHDTIIGRHCFLSPRVAIAGFVNIGEQSIIGINSTIIDNISICRGTQLGGGSVVIKSIDVPGLYVGNPAKFVR